MLREWISSRIPVVLVFYGISLSCAALLVFGLYLQHAVGLEPCPMCIVQRYLLVLVGVFSAMVAFFHGSKSKRIVFLGLMVLAALSGAVVAARQSWLQWYPPEVVSCGRDLYGMIENFPLKRVLPMVFRGSGDCSKIDWTFLGGSIANWSFVTFTLFVLVGALAIGSAQGHRERLQ